MKDWMNQEVTGPETDDTEITVWNIKDSVSDILDYSSITVRSLEELLSTIDAHLEGHDEQELREGVELTIKLQTMKLGEYLSLPE